MFRGLGLWYRHTAVTPRNGQSGAKWSPMPKSEQTLSFMLNAQEITEGLTLYQRGDIDDPAKRFWQAKFKLRSVPAIRESSGTLNLEEAKFWARTRFDEMKLREKGRLPIKDMTFKAATEKWLEHINSLNLSKDTKKSYEVTVRRYMLPFFQYKLKWLPKSGYRQAVFLYVRRWNHSSPRCLALWFGLHGLLFEQRVCVPLRHGPANAADCRLAWSQRPP